MATEKQIAANRRNAQKSTGPKTPEGKANIRFNNLRHGLRSRTLILPNENPEEFAELYAGLEADWQPTTTSARLLVEQMAVSHWQILRAHRAQNAILIHDPNGLERLADLDRLYRQQARFEHAFLRAHQELDWLRRHPQPAATPAEESEEGEEGEESPTAPSSQPPGLHLAPQGSSPGRNRRIRSARTNSG
jgi:hypothetical protein